jgi:hypothetical protein
MFVSFAQTETGVVLANVSATQAASITVTAFDQTGAKLGTATVSLPPLTHISFSVSPFLQIPAFVGSVKLSSATPISALFLNNEASPVFSSLPDGAIN